MKDFIALFYCMIHFLFFESVLLLRSNLFLNLITLKNLSPVLRMILLQYHSHCLFVRTVSIDLQSKPHPAHRKESEVSVTRSVKVK